MSCRIEVESQKTQKANHTNLIQCGAGGSNIRAEEAIPVKVDPDNPDRVLYVGKALPQDEREVLVAFLKNSMDVFAWSVEDIPGIIRSVIEHSLNIKEEVKPKAQGRRPLSDEKAKIVEAEVQRLLQVGFIRESHYPVWIANTVVVPKKNGTWRVCVDFTDLNKAYPKDNFPLPRICQLIDSLVGHERMSFLDACSGYNQIRMNKEDEEHTSFITPLGLYCYIVMPFGLKNVGATFQRLVNKIFHRLLGKTVWALH